MVGMRRARQRSREEASKEAAKPVMLDQAQRQLINIRTTPVVKEGATVTIRTVGIVAYDQTRLVNVNTKINGRPFDEDDRLLLEALAERICLALDRPQCSEASTGGTRNAGD